MRKLWFAALIAAAAAVVTVAVPVIAGENKATTAAKSGDAEQVASRVLPSHRPGKTTATPGKPQPKPTATTAPTNKPTTTTHPTQKPKATPTKTVEPKLPKPPDVDSDEAGPAVAGPCVGTVIKPGQNAQSIVNSKPPGTTFCFAAGLHRISDTIRPKANQVLASAQRAVLTGSVPLTGWAKSGSVWVVRGALPSAYGKSGECEDNKSNICYLREQLFLDDTHLTRVASVAAVKAGKFYADYAANAIYLGSNPTGHEVEMSKTATAIESGASGVAVRGLTIEHFASAPQAGALVSGPSWMVTANDIAGTTRSA
ncbi:hypothetical protein [Kribbella sp. C-35]|uniref:hypothetical protein n=1 Tax=Kribbella sp. C-35 TaxID=2789276 RepID=UPI00397976DC